jgi:Fe-S-cluster containining protein
MLAAMPDNTLDDGFEEEEDDDDDSEEELKEATCECRCGECCRRLLIEVDLEDAEREPRIKELGSPTFTDARLTRSGKRELEGYLLNSRDDMACVFLDREKNLCTIYETRPLGCRVFDCDREGREQMIELGIFEKDSSKMPDSDSR